MRARFETAAEQAARVKDGDTIAIAGSGGGLIEPDAVIEAIEKRFLATGHPKGLTIVHALGIGARGERGMSRLAHPGMVRRVIGGHWTWSPQMQALAESDAIEAFTLPAGAIMLLVREIGAGRPGLFTHVGLGTFADPRHGGGAVNDRARAAEPLVELARFDGKEVLRYKPFKIDVGIIRGSDADDVGNITTAREAADIDVKGVALAAHNSGGVVLAQVQNRVPRGSIRARAVAVPGVQVDSIILAPDQPQSHLFGPYDLALAGEVTGERPTGTDEPPPQGLRRIIASRAADEVGRDVSVNFGFGIPGGIPALLQRQGRLQDVWITVEQGMHNGQLLDGDLFGASRYPDAMVSSLDQFDFYSGGGIDVACLGMAELDHAGNVNVSRLGGKVIGPGGFVDITQNARKVVFCGTFEAKGLKARAHAGGLVIDQPGAVQKLVADVAEITFSGGVARAKGQDVLYVTERAVFRLTDQGVELVEVAAGVDIATDIVQRMGFAPIINGAPGVMAARHFDDA
jgi:propionate CoA-transferase